MHRYLSLFLLLALSCSPSGRQRGEDGLVQARLTQEALSRQYLDPETTILSESQRLALESLGGLNFFPVSAAYIVPARLERYEDPEVITMPTSSDRLAEYRVYGRVSFELLGRPDTLTVFETTMTQLPEEYRNLLFLPFRDRTTGTDTYGGGRYLDLPKPGGDRILIDFNRAYHPYCAYSYGYSCPVPPAANFVDQRVEAGIRDTDLGE